MVLFVDLDDEDHLDPRQSSGFANLEHHTRKDGVGKDSVIEDRPNPNLRNGFAAILSCYP
jgi:hypothetical protein